MISIESYRIAVGFLNQYLLSSSKFNPKFINISFNHSNRKSALKKPNNKIQTKSLCIHFLSGITIIFSLIAFSVLLLSFHDGDIQNNPGPNYTIDKIVNGSYRQSDEDLVIKQEYSVPSVHYLHCLGAKYNQGDVLYNLLNTYDMLSKDALPWSIISIFICN